MRATRGDSGRRAGVAVTLRFVGGLAVASTLSGCGVHPVDPVVETPGMPNAEKALQTSLAQTASELARIGAMAPAAATSSMPTVTAAELDRVVSMQWNGALDGAVAELAKTVGYRATVSGAPGRGGLNVAIGPAPQRVYDILHSLGDQAGELATVRVDSQHQMIEVIYHDVVSHG